MLLSLVMSPIATFPVLWGRPIWSAALSVGTLSPRQAWVAAREAREQARSDEQLSAIGVWEQELGWREFYQQALFHFSRSQRGSLPRTVETFSLGEQRRVVCLLERRADRDADH